MEVFTDTFTVENPDNYYVFSGNQGMPEDDIIFHQLHYKIEQTTQDLYVSPNGNNSNSGLSPDSALKTVSFALLKAKPDTASPDTIHLAEGTYSFSSGEKFPLTLKSFVNIKGENRDSTILNPDYKTYILKSNYKFSDFTISDLTFTKGYGEEEGFYRYGGFFLLNSKNVSFNNVVFCNCIGHDASIGDAYNCENLLFNNVKFSNNKGRSLLLIYHGNYHTELHYDTITFLKCIFENNTHMDNYSGGQGIHIFSDYGEENYLTVIFNNCLFNNNFSTEGATSIDAYLGCKVYLVNSTFASNKVNYPSKANISLLEKSRFYCYNSIFYNPETNYELSINASYNGFYLLKLYNSLIFRGVYGINNSTSDSIIYYDTTNINTIPLFYGGAEFPYNLSDESPCIDAGTQDLPQFILDNMPETDLAGNPRIFNGKIDMGAYEWNPTVDVKENPATGNQQPATDITAAPNPFSFLTYISAQWDKKANVTIAVYNYAGLPVKTLQSGIQLPGNCRMPWNGTDNNGNLLPAGVYLIVLTVDGKNTGSVKVVKR